MTGSEQAPRPLTPEQLTEWVGHVRDYPVLFNPQARDVAESVAALLAEREWLREALIAHRADLHCYSSRGCPTCDQSAAALGIKGKVPRTCAKADADVRALAGGSPGSAP
jgi:hypothetical protein